MILIQPIHPGRTQQKGVAVFSLLPKAVFVFAAAVNLGPLVESLGHSYVKCYVVAVHKGKVSI